MIQEITMNPHEIAKATLTWNSWPGFSGETCGECKSKVNALGQRGFHCPNCNHFNMQNYSTNAPIWGEPDYGPTQKTIRRGRELSTRDTRRQRKFADEQKVLVNMALTDGLHAEQEWYAARIIRMSDDNPSEAFGMRYYHVRLEGNGKYRWGEWIKELTIYEKKIRKSYPIFRMPDGRKVYFQLFI